MSDPKALIGKRIRVKEHVQAPPGLVGLEGLVTDVRALEPADDDVLVVHLDGGRDVFVPVDAIEVLA